MKIAIRRKQLKIAIRRKQLKIAISGGHLTPALALIEELEKNKNIKVVFLGRRYATEGSKNLSVEYRELKQRNIKFYPILAGRLTRKFTRFTPVSLLKIPIGFVQTFLYLLWERPTIVLSFGGYLSTPLIFGAWLLGIDSFVHEQATVPGFANRINATFTKKVFVSFSETTNFFEKGKTEVIGNLIRPAIYKTEAKSPHIKKFLSDSKNLIYVTGGNQGSHFLNRLIFNSLDELSDFRLLHQVGETNYQGDLDKSQKIKNKNYLAVGFLGDGDIGAVLAKSELIVSRAGANTVWEIAVLGKVSLLIPLPISASGEQQANARVLEKAGSSIVASQDLNSQTFLKLVKDAFRNHQKLKKRARDFSKVLPKDAAQKLAAALLIYLN